QNLPPWLSGRLYATHHATCQAYGQNHAPLHAPTPKVACTPSLQRESHQRSADHVVPADETSAAPTHAPSQEPFPSDHAPHTPPASTHVVPPYDHPPTRQPTHCPPPPTTQGSGKHQSRGTACLASF